MIPITFNMMEKDAKTLSKFASVGRTMQNVKSLLEDFATTNADPRLTDRIEIAIEDLRVIGDILSRLHLDVRDAIWKRGSTFQENISHPDTAFIITTGGAMTPVFPKEGKEFTLEEMQEIVGGSIELLQLPEGRWMVINEEGKIHRLPLNGIATTIFQAAFRGAHDVIVGNVLLALRHQIS